MDSIEFTLGRVAAPREKTRVGARAFSERGEKVGESEKKSMTLMAVGARGGARFFSFPWN
jgi:hypothetical protein